MTQTSCNRAPIRCIESDWRDRTVALVVVARSQQQLTLSLDCVPVEGLLSPTSRRVEVFVADVAVLAVALAVTIDIVEVIDGLTCT